eukprot:2840426-Pleurochrysis_carterae.AAC.1
MHHMHPEFLNNPSNNPVRGEAEHSSNLADILGDFGRYIEMKSAEHQFRYLQKLKPCTGSDYKGVSTLTCPRRSSI